MHFDKPNKLLLFRYTLMLYRDGNIVLDKITPTSGLTQNFKNNGKQWTDAKRMAFSLENLIIYSNQSVQSQCCGELGNISALSGHKCMWRYLECIHFIFRWPVIFLINVSWNMLWSGMQNIIQYEILKWLLYKIDISSLSKEHLINVWY